VKITFIGTSSGKISLKRFHSSLLFSSEKYNLLVDAGDGISRALIGNGINFNSINGILFTHLHPDHFSGLPALIIQMKMINRIEPLDIFINDSLRNVVEEILLKSYLLPERMGFEILYKTFRDNERLSIRDNFSFLARKNSHLSNLEKLKTKYLSLSLYSASFLFKTGNKKVIYTSDISSQEDLFLFNDVVADIFISETTHLSPNTILNNIIGLNPGKIYLTHYSDEDIPAVSENLATIPAELKEKVKLAEDGLSLEI
jgi:ribonuclease Z